MSKFLTEGAGGGHMWHPFDVLSSNDKKAREKAASEGLNPEDLPSVATGKDLLDFFQSKVMDYVRTNQKPDIKLDGSNATAKLIRSEDGTYKFAIDRGSSSDLDVNGVTIDNLEQRFPKKVILQVLETGEEIGSNINKMVNFGLSPADIEEGRIVNVTHKKKMIKVRIKEVIPHGMVFSNTMLLEIFNAALEADQEKIVEYIQKLSDDLLNNETSQLVFSCEMIMEGSTDGAAVNAIEYGEGDVIAVHGLREIFVKPGSKKGARDSNLIPLVKGSPYYKMVGEIVDLMKANNPHKDAKVFYTPRDVFAEVNRDVKISFKKPLGEKIAIRFFKDEEPIIKTLEQWLNDPQVVLPSYTEKMLFANNKKMSVFSKQVYQYLIPDKGNPISVQEIIADGEREHEDKYMKFVSSALFYHATRVLGREVLKGYLNANKVGAADLNSHEGLVMNDPDIFGTHKNVKITGDFIFSGMAGGFSSGPINEWMDMVMSLVTGNRSEVDENIEKTSRSLAFLPGSFKPPHIGHYKLALQALSMADEVYVIVSDPKSSKSQRPISFINKLISYEDAVNLWKAIDKDTKVKIPMMNNRLPSPVAVVYEMLMGESEVATELNLDLKNYDKVFLILSDKDNTSRYQTAVDRAAENGIQAEILQFPASEHSGHYKDLLNILASNSPEDYRELPAIKKQGKNPMDFHASDLRYLMGLWLSGKNKTNTVLDMIADFVGQANVEKYLGAISGASEEQEIREVIYNFVRKVVLDEVSAMGAAGGGAIEGGQSTGRKKRKKGGRAVTQEEDEWLKKRDVVLEEEDDNDEPVTMKGNLPPGKYQTRTTLPATQVSNITYGNTDDSWAKKAIKMKHVFNTNDPIAKRRPHYEAGDIIEPLVQEIFNIMTK